MNHVAANLVNIPPPIARGYRRRFRLHDDLRRHGPDRYEPPPREPNDPRRGAHPQYHQWHWHCFNDRWIWLRPHMFDLTYSRCIVCHVNFRSNIRSVTEHEESGNHVRNMRNINVPVDPDFDPHLDAEGFYTERATIKLLLSAWFADEGVAYRKIDTLLPLIKRIARYPGVLQEVKLTRTTMSKIIKGIIAPVHKQQLAATLSRSKFATLFDESTAITNEKSGCLLLRFADVRTFKITTVLWDLIPIYREDDEHSDATAESLFNLTIHSLFSPLQARAENRPVLRRNNYIASGSDGCNTMVGVNNSVRQRLYDNFEGINHVTCTCHGAHLCSKHAMEMYFAVIINILKDCYNWFVSAKRLHRLLHHQIRLNLDTHRLLRFVMARWLTGLPSLNRLTEQIMAIDATLAEVAPNNVNANDLLQRLRSQSIQCCIAFLTFILEVPEDFNGFMQTEEVIFPEVYSRICTDFKDIVRCYMEEDYVENVDLIIIDVEDPDHFLPYNDMRIGEESRRIAGELVPEEYNFMMERFRRFLIHLATDWYELLLLPWARYKCTECLLVQNALSPLYHVANPNVIEELMQQFPRAFPEGIEDMIRMEWDLLMNIDRNLINVLPENVRTDYFWFYVRQIQDEEGFHPYLELADFALSVLCTPHSNAQPERIWSIDKYNRNQWRNKLSLLSARSIIMIREMLALQGCSKKIYAFIPHNDMITRVRARIYDITQNIPAIIIDENEAEEENEEEDDDSDMFDDDEFDDSDENQ